MSDQTRYFEALSAALRRNGINIEPKDLMNLSRSVSGGIAPKEGELALGPLNIGADATIEIKDGHGRYENDWRIIADCRVDVSVRDPTSPDVWHVKAIDNGDTIFDNDVVYDKKYTVQIIGHLFKKTYIAVDVLNKSNPRYNGRVAVHVEL